MKTVVRCASCGKLGVQQTVQHSRDVVSYRLPAGWRLVGEPDAFGIIGAACSQECETKLTEPA